MTQASAKRSYVLVSVMFPGDIIEAEERAYEWGGRAGLDRSEIIRLVAAVARMGNMLLRVAGQGSLVFTVIDRNGTRGLEVATQSDAPAWSPKETEISKDTAALMDEMAWEPTQDGHSRLIARKWRQLPPQK